ncbi:response regulator [Sodalis sp. dw_96]|uniref:response regulator transcription factor n=1 Tax=Sodalis sp. dw_96 TaxID=2719794 RepID=UPI001BD57F50|nr:response regulator [Sodalis sp. dw_96]
MTPPPLIAIVDDDRSVRSGLSNLLQSAGYATRSFESAEAFLNQGPGAAKIALIILDVKLKGIDGFELYERLLLWTPPPWVIFISGHGDENTHRLAVNAGAIAFLRKPIDVDILLESIQRALSSGEGTP